MNFNKAGKKTKAFWRSGSKNMRQWEKEGIEFKRINDMMRGHAAGWIDGIAWERRRVK